ncbi:hypothetical protein EA462_07845 [Natrarchaeobius halalkaliphilus]|uniref:Uncharacterized protein n=1 Tax=Natrarchaeobius halalkaliphilus TaxID=1679091 RepID=A0A3N6LRU8_9EURY|nr:hypothetical protein [Natrarchaeobius halalkaliphilus]RQG89914.1 hypothetical protein EA462_07845 [Natrarchaeobius halalkaliphilus]
MSPELVGRLTRSERWTAVLVVVFTATIYPVYAVANPSLWLAWAIGTVATAGSLLVILNRSRST